MQWNNGVSAGFSTSSDTWIKVNPRQLERINVESEKIDPSSILNFYKELIHLRGILPSLYDGEFIEVPTSGNLIAFKRKKGEEICLTLINLGKKPLKLEEGALPSSYDVLISTYTDKKKPSDILRPYEGLLLKVK